MGGKFQKSEQIGEAEKKKNEVLTSLLRETETRLDNKNTENKETLRKLKEIENLQEQTETDLKEMRMKNKGEKGKKKFIDLELHLLKEKLNKTIERAEGVEEKLKGTIGKAQVFSKYYNFQF